MKITASSICWARDSRAGVLKKAREAGFTAIELLTFPPEIFDLHGNLNVLQPSDLKQELSDAGLALAALHLGAVMTPNEKKRRALTDYAKRAIDFAQELDCQLIVEGGPYRATEPFEPFLESLEELQRYIERRPVSIALENHYGNWIQFAEDYERIFARFDQPQIGMTLDTGHFCSAGVDPVEIARRFGKRVLHVHVKDHIGTQSMALGAGKTDNFGVVRELKKHAYSGYLSQEIEVHDHENADRYAREGFHYLRRLCEI